MLECKRTVRWEFVGLLVGGKLGQVAIKIYFQAYENFDPISEGILENLGIDFGWFWGAIMESKTEPKIRSMKF